MKQSVSQPASQPHAVIARGIVEAWYRTGKTAAHGVPTVHLGKTKYWGTLLYHKRNGSAVGEY